MKTIIIDGYVDEPACLGIPPYVSPYPRYIYGLLKYLELNPEYYTIDSLRIKNFQITDNYDFCIIIGGLSVPGKYLNTHPITLNEIYAISSSFSRAKKIIVGALKYGWTIEGGKTPLPVNENIFELITDSNIYLKQIFDYLTEKISIADKNFDKEMFARLGCECVNFHHYYPNVICEIETYTGCLRQEKCSFCVEQFSKPSFNFRTQKAVIDEIKLLTQNGIVHFRIGNQPDIFGYYSQAAGINYKPSPDALEKLFYGIRATANSIKTLHTDNANPAIIADFPFESTKIIQTLCKYTTGGNILALGCETFDNSVIEKNNLNSRPEQGLKAVELINEYGAYSSENGMPQLLPGVNMLFGLAGETADTWKINYEFLAGLLKKNLLLRRINIRQVIKFENTKIKEIFEKPKNPNKLKFIFKKYKDKIREDIDREMLKKIAPLGTIIKNALVEKIDKHLSFARQIGAYPLIICSAEKLEQFKFYDFAVVNYGYRSITGLTLPVNINTLSYDCLKSINSISKKEANNIIFNRPYSSDAEMPDNLKWINNILTIPVMPQ